MSSYKSCGAGCEILWAQRIYGSDAHAFTVGLEGSALTMVMCSGHFLHGFYLVFFPVPWEHPDTSFVERSFSGALYLHNSSHAVVASAWVLELDQLLSAYMTRDW